MAILKSVMWAFVALMAPKPKTKKDLENECAALRARVEELEKSKDGEKGETEEKEEGDPMEGVEETDLAAKAGAAAKPRSGKQAGPSAKPLKEVDASILLNGITEDDFIEAVRAYANAKCTHLISLLPEDQRPELTTYVEKFVAAAYQLTMGYDLAKRGYAIKDKVSKQASRVIKGTDSHDDSPEKISALTKLLGQHRFHLDTVKQQLDGMFDLAAGKIESATASDGLSAEKFLLDLGALLSQHRQAKKTRATKQDFANHVSRAVKLVTVAIAAAESRKEHELAFKLMQSLHTLEAALHDFFAVTDKLGFETARDVYLSKGNAFAGMGITQQAWDNMVAMASNKEYPDIFKKLLDGKLPSVNKGKRANADSDSDSDASADSKPSGSRKRKNTSANHHGAPRTDNRPYCVSCNMHGHTIANCRTLKSLLAPLQALKGAPGDNNGGKKHDRRPGNA